MRHLFLVDDQLFMPNSLGYGEQEQIVNPVGIASDDGMH